jgi:prepilin-type N-terminal cleavage/methylation domain-containing protein
MKHHETGFTLIEISIVLVIIGLLLGGVLKGQELINSAKVKNFAQDFRAVPTLINAYQDKFRALPGDDGRAQTHVCPASNPACTVNGNANGVINGNWDDAPATASETVHFWQQVRLANLATGASALDAPNFLPLNSDGGRIGIQSGGTAPPLGLSGGYIVCSAGILGKYVRQLDTTLDDSDPRTGSMRAGIASAGVLAAIGASDTLDDGAAYTVCMGI